MKSALIYNKVKMKFFSVSSFFVKKLFLIVALMFSLSVYGETPTEAVSTMVGSVLGILGEKELSADARKAQIRAEISTAFDFRAMSQSVLSVNWKKASKEQQSQFVGLFSQLLEDIYIGRIQNYTDEKVEYSKETVKKTRAVVETKIVTSSVNIPVDYKLRFKKETWLVYDVVVENVSLVRNYRESYQSIVKKSGMDGLLKLLEEKIQQLNAPEA